MRRFLFACVLGLSVASLGPSSENAATAAGGRILTGPVPTTQTPPSESLPDRARLPLRGNRILAFYGKPGAKSMGILGEYSKEEVANLLFGYAKLYADALAAQEKGEAPASGVIPAFYLVYGACWPGGDIGYLSDSVVKEWIDYAASQGILVFLDHQIGRYGVKDAMDHLLPWLAYPNVQLALDPEWRTENPMQEIGSISADELNQAQSQMSDYLKSQGIQGDRLLVVHQFTAGMIAGRDKVKADWPGVLLIHTTDGFGSPSLKKSVYSWNAKAVNMPLKGVKLFLKGPVPGAGFDDPLLTPVQVLDLVPTPELIIYQ